MFIYSRIFRQLQRWGCLFLASLLIVTILQTLPLGSVAQMTPIPSLVSLGIERYQAGEFKLAIELWLKALSQPLTPQSAAIVHSNLATAFRQIGQIDRAIAHWDEAIAITKQQKDRLQLGRLLTEQAQAYNDIGQHPRAIELLKAAIELARQNQDQPTLAAALGITGSAYWSQGDYQQAIPALQTSLEIAQQINNRLYITIALNNLGNVYASRGKNRRIQAETATNEGEINEAKQMSYLAAQDNRAALEAFEKSVALSQNSNGIGAVRALLNLSRILLKLQADTGTDINIGRIANLRQQALQKLASMPDSRDKAYALINIGRLDMKYHLSFQISPVSTQQQLTTEKVLETAIAVAQSIDDARAQSFAFGIAGQMYEKRAQYQKALQLSRQAQLAAQQIQAADSLYQWQWLSGRLHKATGDRVQAIESYKQAIASLESIRGDIIVANQDIQFDFRDDQEPVYRELIALLLEQSKSKAGVSNLENLKEALSILDLLKLAELRDFFGDDCVHLVKETVERIGANFEPTAAIIYSIVMSDRTEIILQLPDRSLTGYSIDISNISLEQEINLLRKSLEKRATEEYLPHSQKVYDLLIRPLEKQLAAAQPSTLVFINDGVLRKVPMAALHDGQEFLIQKYPIATTPSLSVTISTPLNLSGIASKDDKSALIVGLTVARPPFPALKNVQAEVDDVKNILGGTKLLDTDFTKNQLQLQLQKGNYPIIHIATHGKFGTDADKTFLLAYDSNITIQEIDSFLRFNSKLIVELLTLSACQTATGNNRSALGMGGVAVRAGVKSALASLWSINDLATVPLMEEFYSQLKQPNITKAQALQKAQMKMISIPDFNHPAVWAPFLLIGNWQ